MSFFLAASSLYLECSYVTRTVWTDSNAYTCNARVINVGDLRSVSDVSRNHLAGKNHYSVNGILFSNQGIRVLPTNIDVFFENIETIQVTISLEEISQDDLSKFPKLKELHLNSNKIQVIDSNLFAGNPLMTSISFISNPIRNVAPEVFDRLSNLINLRFDGVTCHSQAAFNRNDVSKLIAVIAVKCPATFEMNFEIFKARVMNELSSERNSDNQRFSKLNEEIHNLKLEIQEMSIVKEFLKNNQGRLCQTV